MNKLIYTRLQFFKSLHINSDILKKGNKLLEHKSIGLSLFQIIGDCFIRAFNSVFFILYLHF